MPAVWHRRWDKYRPTKNKLADGFKKMMPVFALQNPAADLLANAQLQATERGALLRKLMADGSGGAMPRAPLSGIFAAVWAGQTPDLKNK